MQSGTHSCCIELFIKTLMGRASGSPISLTREVLTLSGPSLFLFSFSLWSHLLLVELLESEIRISYCDLKERKQVNYQHVEWKRPKYPQHCKNILQNSFGIVCLSEIMKLVTRNVLHTYILSLVFRNNIFIDFHVIFIFCYVRETVPQNTIVHFFRFSVL